MGQVFRAVHPRMKRDVAIKVLPPNLLQSSEAIARFEREVEAAARRGSVIRTSSPRTMPGVTRGCITS